MGIVTPTRGGTGDGPGRPARSGLLRGRFSRHTAEPVYQITGARRGVRDDVNSRTRRYLVSMGVRTACFIGAVVADGWLRWVLIVAALILPYLSVVFANGGREKIEEAPLTTNVEDLRPIRHPDR
ncbi:MAG: hypothetical protein QOH75_2216 [Actinomycetota bacterium]|nr:hypothetical protein [Actinomycetota bacterium]